ncbi:hypothetical protein NMY22_g12966 [Coprinellus aureogranulatus]|nr:hypothetical protein NMY22_g12966 [Coprinellus aureogranulatus]
MSLHCSPSSRFHFSLFHQSSSRKRTLNHNKFALFTRLCLQPISLVGKADAFSSSPASSMPLCPLLRFFDYAKPIGHLVTFSHKFQPPPDLTKASSRRYTSLTVHYDKNIWSRLFACRLELDGPLGLSVVSPPHSALTSVDIRDWDDFDGVPPIKLSFVAFHLRATQAQADFLATLHTHFTLWFNRK